MISNKDENIIKESVIKLLEEKFGNYSKYIILDRALPDMRDGLKPVQRRILYAMSALKINYKSSYKKSARIVGEVIGKYHPHGDSSVYEAMVRMCQVWKMRYPIVDMHGNKGSVDGDPAAAMRYTEVRLSEITELLLSDLKSNTVNFKPNFDDNESEPVILPAKIPNLLMNGSVGIASGYSTNIPPHNIVELIDSIIYLIKNKNATVENLSEILMGPDFPTGGIIIGQNGINDMYSTGKGSFVIRSKTEIDKKNNAIKVTEIPYEVNKSELIKQIDDVSINRNIGVKSVIDMTNKDGIHIEIKYSSTSNPNVVLENLFKFTDLQKNYSANLVAISENKPIQFTIINYLNNFIDYQRYIYTNKYNFELKKYQTRLEIVKGLIKAVSNIDQVIKIIRSSKNKLDAKNNLIKKFKFTQLQAEAIVTLRLYRLTNTDVDDLVNEKKELQEKVIELEKILSSKSKLDSKIIKFLKEIGKEEGDIRRTIISNKSREDIRVEEKDLIDKKEVVFSITYHGYLKAVSTRSAASNDWKKFGLKENDTPISIIKTFNTNLLIALTSKGKYIVIPIYKIKEAMWKDIGEHINVFAKLNGDEKIIGSFITKDISADIELLVTTKLGKIKRIKFSDLKTSRINSAIRFVKLYNNDEVSSIIPLFDDSGEVVVVTEFCNYVRYSIDKVPLLSLTAQGVTAMNMEIDDAVIAGNIIINEDVDYVVVATNDGHIRKTIANSLKQSNTRTAKPKSILPISKSSKNKHIVSSFVSKSTGTEINVIDDNGVWYNIDSRDLSISEPSMTSKKKYNDGILYTIKNSFYDFSILEDTRPTIKKEIKEKQEIHEIKKPPARKITIEEFNNIEQTIEITKVNIEIKKVEANNVNKKINLNELYEDE